MSFDADTFVAELISNGLALKSEIVGCSEAELNRIEERVGVTFPSVYRQFMRRMGKAAGKFLLGSDVYLDQIEDNRDCAVELLRESGVDFSLPQGSCVFLVHQGYVFQYFVADGVTDDPPVYQYVENQPYPELVSDHLSNYYQRRLATAKKHARE